MQAVIFDVDGTLVDSVDLHTKAWQEAFAHFGHQIHFDRIRAQIGKGGDQLMPVFLTKAELAEHGEELERFRGEHFKKHYLSEVRGFPGVRALFQRLLADGWRLALASSAKGDELSTYKRVAEIADLIDTETSADDAEKSKPHPDIFLAALERLRLPASACFVVGDSPYDAEAAGKVPMRAIGLRCGGFPPADLKTAGFETLYQDPADLLARYEDSPFASAAPQPKRT